MSSVRLATKETMEGEENVNKKRKKESTKVVVRHLPPSMTRDMFMTHVNLRPIITKENEESNDEQRDRKNDNSDEDEDIDEKNDVRVRHGEDVLILEDDQTKVVDFFYFEGPDLSLQANAFSRAYLNFRRQSDLFEFTEKYDNYVFVDNRGQEYLAIVEYAVFQALPNTKMADKEDARCGSLENDQDYKSFIENLEKEEEKENFSVEQFLEEMERKEKAARETQTTPLLEFMKERKERRDDRRRRDEERRRLRNAANTKAKETKINKKNIDEGSKRGNKGRQEKKDNDDASRASKDKRKKQDQIEKKKAENVHNPKRDSYKSKRQGSKFEDSLSNKSGNGSKGSKDFPKESSGGSEKQDRPSNKVFEEDKSSVSRHQQQKQQPKQQLLQRQQQGDKSQSSREDEGKRSKRYSERRREGFASNEDSKKDKEGKHNRDKGTESNTDSAAGGRSNKGGEARGGKETRSNKSQRPEREYYRPGQSRLSSNKATEKRSDEEGGKGSNRSKGDQKGQRQQKDAADSQDTGFRRAPYSEGRGGGASRVFYSSKRGQGRRGQHSNSGNFQAE